MRRSALAIGAFLIAAQAANVAHLATAAHATCAEHGELIEAGEPHAVAQASPGADATVEDAVASDGAAHEHCTALFHRRASAVAPAGVQAAAGTAAPPVAVATPLLVPPQLRPLDQAPKSSPPAV